MGVLRWFAGHSSSGRTPGSELPRLWWGRADHAAGVTGAVLMVVTTLALPTIEHGGVEIRRRFKISDSV
jgi:hypothetical protein